MAPCTPSWHAGARKRKHLSLLPVIQKYRAWVHSKAAAILPGTMRHSSAMQKKTLLLFHATDQHLPSTASHAVVSCSTSAAPNRLLRGPGVNTRHRRCDRRLRYGECTHATLPQPGCGNAGQPGQKHATCCPRTTAAQWAHNGDTTVAGPRPTAAQPPRLTPLRMHALSPCACMSSLVDQHALPVRQTAFAALLRSHRPSFPPPRPCCETSPLGPPVAMAAAQPGKPLTLQWI